MPQLLLRSPTSSPRAGQQVHLRTHRDRSGYRKSGTYRNKVQNLTQFYHPLDMFGEWNRAYGPAGSCSTSSSSPPRRGGVQSDHRRHPGLGHYSFLNVFKLFGRETKRR